MRSTWSLRGQGATRTPAGGISKRAAQAAAGVRDGDRRRELHANRAHAVEAKAVAPWLALVPISEGDLPTRIAKAQEMRAADLGAYADVPLLTSFEVAAIAKCPPRTTHDHITKGYLVASCTRPHGADKRCHLFTQEAADAYAARIARNRKKKGVADA